MKLHKLYEVEPGTYIRVKDEGRHPPVHRDFEPEEVLYFHHLDGMYSLCSDKDGNAVHLAGYSDVEITENPGWKDYRNI